MNKVLFLQKLSTDRRAYFANHSAVSVSCEPASNISIAFC